MDLKKIVNNETYTKQNVNNNVNSKEVENKKETEKVTQQTQQQDKTNEEYIKTLNENGVANNINKIV